MSEESVKLCFLVTFSIIISYIFPENFIEIHQSLRFDFLLLRFELFMSIKIILGVF